MELSKKWLPLSLLFHAFLLLVLRLIIIEPGIQEQSIQEISLNIVDVTPVEQPEQKTSQESTTAQTEPPRIPVVVQEEIAITEKTTLPPDFTMFRNPPDSTLIIRDRLREYYRNLKVVPFKSNIFEVFTMELEELPAKPMNLRDSLQMIVNESRLLQFDIGEVAILNDVIGDEFYSKNTNPTLPVIPLIAAGISLAGKLINKIFNLNTPAEINRILTINEIYIFKVVWSLKNVSPSELYSRLPLEATLTMDDVLIRLEQLSQKGILQKRSGRYEEIFSPAVSRKELFLFYLTLYSERKSEAESDNYDGAYGVILEDLKNKVLLLSYDEIKK